MSEPLVAPDIDGGGHDIVAQKTCGCDDDG